MEAINTAVYILNRCPTKAVYDRTPLEAWSNQKPSVKHLKVFGCVAFVQVPTEKRTKLDPKSKKMMFVGYSAESKAYRLIDPENKKIVVSRDVIFDEDHFWSDDTARPSSEYMS